MSDQKLEKLSVAFHTQGCRLNQAETAVLSNQFINTGFSVTDDYKSCNIIVVNTCTVTENGDKDTRRLVRKLTLENPEIQIALIGCQSQILKDQLKLSPHIRWIIGNEKKMSLDKLIKKTVDNPSHDPIIDTQKITRTPFIETQSSFDPKHTRVNLKIQDGCDFYCSFCVIPFARGPARSRNFDNIIQDAHQLATLGVKEIILTGINVGTYDDSEHDILSLVKALHDIDGLARIRISSIEPTTIPFELIEMMDGKSKLARYLHIPIQSASPLILKKMKRKYNLKTFDTYIQKVKSFNPDICIGTDVIVGFPGETEKEFEETRIYLEQAPIDYFHVFSYSERQNTRSLKFPDKVPTSDIKKRSKILREMSQTKKLNFAKQFINRPLSLLTEEKKQGLWTGLSDNYIRLFLPLKKGKKNTLIEVIPNEIMNKGLHCLKGDPKGGKAPFRPAAGQLALLVLPQAGKPKPLTRST